MRIDAMNQVSQLYQTSGTRKLNRPGTGMAPDRVEISQFGRDIQVAKAAVQAAPEVREDKVAQIKAAMEAETYHVSDEDLAEKLMGSFDI